MRDLLMSAAVFIRVLLAALAILVALGSCGRPPPTATPSPTATLPYRQALIAQANRVSGAVNVARDACINGSVDRCGQILPTQEAAYQEAADWLRSVQKPQGCEQIAQNYTFVLTAARDFFDKAKMSAAQDDRAGLRQIVQERMVSFDQSWSAFNNALPNDPCK